MHKILPNLLEIADIADKDIFLLHLKKKLDYYILNKKDEIRFIDCNEYDNDCTLFSSGSSLHRGYFCPNPIADIICGNVNRGVLLKNVASAKSKITHKYKFNNDELQTVFEYKNKELLSLEKIFYQENIAQAFLWSCDLLSAYSETEYADNNQISMYSKCILNPLNCEVLEIEQYHFFYKETMLDRCNSVYFHFYAPDSISFSKNKYIFSVDNGKIKDFSCNNKVYKCCTNRPANKFTYKPHYAQLFNDLKL